MTVVKGEQPFALAVKSDFLDSTCSFCLAHNSPVAACSGCTVLYYCNEDCKKSDWVNHKDECRILRTQCHLSADERLVLRILLKSEEELAEEAFNGRTWDSLDTHYDETKTFLFVRFFMDETRFIRHMHELLKKEQDDIATTLKKVKTNRLDIYDSNVYEEIIASGIYLGLSALAESCLPTSQVIFIGRKATLRPFDQNADYSPDLTITRTSRSPFSADRQFSFGNSYFYSCQCPLCTDKNHIMNRIGESCYVDCCEDGVGLLEYRGSYKCNKCGAPSQRTDAHVYYAKKHIKKLADRVSLGDEENFLKELKICEKILSPFNYVMVDFCYHAFLEALNNDRLMIWEHLEARVSAALEYYFPDGHITRTSVPFTRSYMAFELKLSFAVDEGYKAVVLTFGEDHPVTKRFKAEIEKYKSITSEVEQMAKLMVDLIS